VVSTLLVALDVPTGDEAVRLARDLQPHVGGFKVGLGLLMGEGPGIVTRVADIGAPVFVDAKLHDIPNTVTSAAGRLRSIGARWVTVHASGGTEMLEAAAEALSNGSGAPVGVLAVTVLTSLDGAGLREVGVERSVGEQAKALAVMAARAGAEGVVCAVSEAAGIKSLGLDVIVATPGIRPATTERGDQRRVATVGAATAAGADLLVVGRPIIAAEDPVVAAQEIAQEMEEAVRAAPPSTTG
jgi:orotidine-5'-phosphate decarboxylase